MTDANAASLVQLLVREAPRLRAAGVTSFELEGGRLTATLAPPDPPEVKAAEADPPPPANALDDPDTFGGQLPVRRGMLYNDEESQS